MAQQSSSLNPLDFVRQFRKNYVNLHNLWTRRGNKAPEGVTLRDPKQFGLNEKSLPEATRSLLAEYRKAHPGLKMAIVKYMRIVNGTPETVVEDDADLPPENEFLSLSQTVTMNTSDHVRVITEIIIAIKQ